MAIQIDVTLNGIDQAIAKIDALATRVSSIPKTVNITPVVDFRDITALENSLNALQRTSTRLTIDTSSITGAVADIQDLGRQLVGLSSGTAAIGIDTSDITVAQSAINNLAADVAAISSTTIALKVDTSQIDASKLQILTDLADSVRGVSAGFNDVLTSVQGITAGIDSTVQSAKDLVSELEKSRTLKAPETSDAKFTGLFSGVSNAARDLENQTVQTFKNIGNAIIDPFKNVGRVIATPFRTVGRIGKSAVDNLTAPFRNVSGLILNPLKIVGIDIQSTFSNIFTSIGQGIEEQIGRNITDAIGGTINSVFTNTLGQFQEYQSQLTNVSTLLNSNASLTTAFEIGANKLSSALQSQIGTVEVLNATYQALSSGASGAAQAQALVRSSFELSLAAGGEGSAIGASSDDLSKLQASVSNAFGTGFEETDAIAAKLFKTTELGIITLGELSEQLGDVLTLGAQAGVSLEFLLGSLASLTKVGISTPEAATALKNFFQQLLQPSKDFKATLDEISQAEFQTDFDIGILSDDEKTVDFLDALGDAVRSGAKGIEDIAQSGTTAAQAFLAFAANSDILEESIATLRNDTALNSYFNAIEAQSQTAAARIAGLGNSIRDLFQISSGNLGSNILGPIAASITKVANELREAFLKILPVVGVIGRAIGETIGGAFQNVGERLFGDFDADSLLEGLLGGLGLEDGQIKLVVDLKDELGASADRSSALETSRINRDTTRSLLGDALAEAEVSGDTTRADQIRRQRESLSPENFDIEGQLLAESETFNDTVTKILQEIEGKVVETINSFVNAGVQAFNRFLGAAENAFNFIQPFLQTILDLAGVAVNALIELAKAGFQFFNAATAIGAESRNAFDADIGGALVTLEGSDTRTADEQRGDFVEFLALLPNINEDGFAGNPIDRLIDVVSNQDAIEAAGSSNKDFREFLANSGNVNFEDLAASSDPLGLESLRQILTSPEARESILNFGSRNLGNNALTSGATNAALEESFIRDLPARQQRAQSELELRGIDETQIPETKLNALGQEARALLGNASSRYELFFEQLFNPLDDFTKSLDSIEDGELASASDGILEQFQAVTDFAREYFKDDPDKLAQLDALESEVGSLGQIDQSNVGAFTDATADLGTILGVQGAQLLNSAEAGAFDVDPVSGRARSGLGDAITVQSPQQQLETSTTRFVDGIATALEVSQRIVSRGLQAASNSFNDLSTISGIDSANNASLADILRLQGVATGDVGLLEEAVFLDAENLVNDAVTGDTSESLANLDRLRQEQEAVLQVYAANPFLPNADLGARAAQTTLDNIDLQERELRPILEIQVQSLTDDITRSNRIVDSSLFEGRKITEFSPDEITEIESGQIPAAVTALNAELQAIQSGRELNNIAFEQDDISKGEADAARREFDVQEAEANKLLDALDVSQFERQVDALAANTKELTDLTNQVKVLTNALNGAFTNLGNAPTQAQNQTFSTLDPGIQTDIADVIGEQATFDESKPLGITNGVANIPADTTRADLASLLAPELFVDPFVADIEESLSTLNQLKTGDIELTAEEIDNLTNDVADLGNVAKELDVDLGFNPAEVIQNLGLGNFEELDVAALSTTDFVDKLTGAAEALFLAPQNLDFQATRSALGIATGEAPRSLEESANRQVTPSAISNAEEASGDALVQTAAASSASLNAAIDIVEQAFEGIDSELATSVTSIGSTVEQSGVTDEVRNQLQGIIDSYNLDLEFNFDNLESGGLQFVVNAIADELESLAPLAANGLAKLSEGIAASEQELNAIQSLGLSETNIQPQEIDTSSVEQNLSSAQETLIELLNTSFAEFNLGGDISQNVESGIQEFQDQLEAIGTEEAVNLADALDAYLDALGNSETDFNSEAISAAFNDLIGSIGSSGNALTAVLEAVQASVQTGTPTAAQQTVNQATTTARDPFQPPTARVEQSSPSGSPVRVEVTNTEDATTPGEANANVVELSDTTLSKLGEIINGRGTTPEEVTASATSGTTESVTFPELTLNPRSVQQAADTLAAAIPNFSNTVFPDLQISTVSINNLSTQVGTAIGDAITAQGPRLFTINIDSVTIPDSVVNNIGNRVNEGITQGFEAANREGFTLRAASVSVDDSVIAAFTSQIQTATELGFANASAQLQGNITFSPIEIDPGSIAQVGTIITESVRSGFANITPQTLESPDNSELIAGLSSVTTGLSNLNTTLGSVNTNISRALTTGQTGEGGTGTGRGTTQTFQIEINVNLPNGGNQQTGQIVAQSISTELLNILRDANA